MIKGFKILEFNDIHPEIEKLHKYGYDSGKFVGFEMFEKHYNMIEGSCTDWIGYPSSGKTEMCLELLLNTTNFYGWKHLIYAPDIGKSIDIMVKLIHKYSGKTFKKDRKNYIEITTAFNSASHLLDNFLILHKIDSKTQITPIDFWEFAADYSKNNQLNTAMLDSWKDLFHPYSDHKGSYSQYLSTVLPIRNEIAEKSGLHFHTIVHPKNPTKGKDNKIYPPGFNDMEGGAQWGNSGKSIISVHRESFDNTVTDIYFRKIKPESVGWASSTGVSLNFDRSTSRYYTIDQVTQNKIFSKSKEEFEKEKKTGNSINIKTFSEQMSEQDEMPF